MSEAYDKKLRQLAHKIAADLGIDRYMREGVYSMQGGPCFETVAECRALLAFGADVTGERRRVSDLEIGERLLAEPDEL